MGLGLIIISLTLYQPNGWHGDLIQIILMYRVMVGHIKLHSREHRKGTEEVMQVSTCTLPIIGSLSCGW